jgi:hypothetical protein
MGLVQIQYSKSKILNNQPVFLKLQSNITSINDKGLRLFRLYIIISMNCLGQTRLTAVVFGSYNALPIMQF